MSGEVNVVDAGCVQRSHGNAATRAGVSLRQSSVLRAALAESAMRISLRLRPG
jgi:hypothetical protein